MLWTKEGVSRLSLATSNSSKYYDDEGITETTTFQKGKKKEGKSTELQVGVELVS
jgi:hypothetical protein